MHGLRALRDTLQQDNQLDANNVSIGIVGVGESFRQIDGEATKQWLDQLDVAAPATAAMDTE